MQSAFNARISVHDLVQLYEELIAAAANDTLDNPRRILKEQAAKVRSLSDVSLHNLDVDESAPGEPHRGVLKAIDTPISDHDVVDVLEESANKMIQTEPQPVENPQWLPKKNSGCFKLVFRRLIQLFRLHNKRLNHSAQ